MSAKYFMFTRVGQYERRQVDVYFVPIDKMDNSDLNILRNEHNQKIPKEVMKTITSHHVDNDVNARQNVQEVFMLLDNNDGIYSTTSNTL